MASTRLAQHAVRMSSAMGPSVRNLLSHYQLDPGRITSTGPHQTLLKGDVIAYISQHNLQPPKPGQQTVPKQDQHTSATTKPQVHSLKQSDVSVHQIKAGPNFRQKYARNQLTQLEIEVINNGGRL